jgi:DNA polymerase-3 subunit alpha
VDFLDRVTLKAPPRPSAQEGADKNSTESNHVVGKKVVELLIKAGAFDCFGMARSLLMGNLERAFDYAQNKKDDKKFGQSSLFEDSGEKEFPDFAFESVPEWSRAEELRMERELIGYYGSGHPMDAYRAYWEKAVSLDLAHPERSQTGQEYTLVGIIKSLRPVQTKKGAWMGFGVLGDYNGDIDLTLFPKIWEQHREQLVVDQVVALKGKVDRKREQPSFVVEALLDMNGLAEKSYREVHIRLNTASVDREESLYPLRDYLLENSGDCSVFIHVPVPEGEGVVRTAASIGCGAGETTLEALSLCAGVAEVWRQ